MMRVGIAGAVTVFTLYLAMIYGNSALAVLGIAEIIFIVCSFAELLFLRTQCMAGLDLSTAVAKQDDEIRLHLWSRQKFGICPGKVSCRVTAGNHFSGKKKRKWLRANGDYLYLLRLAGRYEFCLEKIRIYDLTGFFYLTKPVKMWKTAEAIPDIYYVPVQLTEAVRNFFGESDQFDDFRPGHDSSELFAVREFQKGDRIQNIHWKLSAKTDEWMVKEHSMPKACAVMILVDFRSKTAKSDFDGILKLTAGLSFSLMDQKCAHFVGWYSPGQGTLIRFRVDDEESFYFFLHTFLQEKADGSVDVEQMYQEKYRSENLLHLLIVNADLEIRKGQEIVGKAEEKNLKQSMENMEIVL